MRLLLLSIEFPPGPGGIGTLAYQAAINLVRLGWQVTAVTPQNFADETEIAQFNAAQPFDIRRLTYVGPMLFEGVSRLWQAYRALRQQQSELILASGEQAVWLGVLLALLTRRSFVAIGIGSEFLRGGKIRRWLTRWAFNRARRLIAISDYTQALMRDADIAVYNSEVILCGADSELYRRDPDVAAISQKWALPNDHVLLTVGRVSARKAQDIVIQALPHVKQSCPQVKYLIAGLPIEQPRLEALAVQLDVVDQVVFLGKVTQDELLALYNRADVFALVSRQTDGGNVEGYGIVVTEAALCGTPAVVANHSGLVETVIPDVTGLVVEPENPEATAHAICRLLLDDMLRQEMGEAARQNAFENATWAKRIGRYDRLLKEILAETK